MSFCSLMSSTYRALCKDKLGNSRNLKLPTYPELLQYCAQKGQYVCHWLASWHLQASQDPSGYSRDKNFLNDLIRFTTSFRTVKICLFTSISILEASSSVSGTSPIIRKVIRAGWTFRPRPSGDSPDPIFTNHYDTVSQLLSFFT